MVSPKRRRTVSSKFEDDHHLLTDPSTSEQISCQNMGMIFGHRYPLQEFDSTSTITSTTYLAIVEGVLLRLEISPPKEVTRGTYHRLKALVDRRISRKRETHVLIRTDLSHVKVWHIAHTIRRRHNRQEKRPKPEDHCLTQDRLRLKTDTRSRQSSGEGGKVKVNLRSCKPKKERL